MNEKKLISIMTPCFNEIGNIENAVSAVRDLFERELPQYDYEHVIIDNASTDGTVETLRELSAFDKRIKVILNSRNFGPHNSPYYAIIQTSGDAVIPIMADLQTPVTLIVDFLREWEKGIKIVVAVRRHSEEGFLLRWMRSTYYRLISNLAHIEQISHFTGFGLFDRKVVEIIRDLDDPNPYFRGIISEIGFEKSMVEFDQPARTSGKSKNTFTYLFEYAIRGLTSYTDVPIRLMTMIGAAVSAISLLLAVSYLVMKLLFWERFDVGMAPVLIGVFFFASVQIFCIGVLGEYMGQIYKQVKRRPLVIESERINFDDPDGDATESPRAS